MFSLVRHAEKLRGRIGVAGCVRADFGRRRFEVIENRQQANRHIARAGLEHRLQLHFIIGRGRRNREGGLVRIGLADIIGNLIEIENALKRRLRLPPAPAVPRPRRLIVIGECLVSLDLTLSVAV